MKLILTLCLFLNLSNAAQASARIYLNFKEGTATLKSVFNYFGEVEGKDEELKQATLDAGRLWAGLPLTENADGDVLTLTMLYRGYNLNLKTDFTYRIFKTVAEAQTYAMQSPNVYDNYVRVEAENKDYSVSATALGCNGIHIVTNHQPIDATSLAHEFGHSMALSHPGSKVVGYPNIMIERGFTAVESKYWYNPNAKLSTMNPKFRRVTKENAFNLLEQIMGRNLKVVDAIEDGQPVQFVEIGWDSIKSDKILFRPQMRKTGRERWLD